ncbi:50S ribosomal protein L11 [Candidatus Nitrosotalea okcheonensis]|uniref:Large ribosomal subunit protein uL11 n=1 Tax=Candidatus Nitrosotalea okcheonensis TaxID=1903276 RepID=A0A2H1FI89_9ARCH|nr:50S ribosomal protein L11 [Candidatus Nitrosotalea okcheonensis]MDE1728399.1 50S ribosomal protein L11 [Nitrososphaerota archaeon]MDE1813963.1 50S ribosomal protein L11 [Nitrososphaerota archaeon]MDE1841696.1 50S ribosomal protein L11 [Nitrososphaerota archaeon]MDE1877929.1 50S ribosomal protein L11 [Nitrososphaerota archaeon]SMH72485.1 50S ribosomal protein L11 [Candidatus Nitrosotalea okcheonensis]
MADIQTVSALVTGGQASAGPPLGPTLGPLGVNILQIVTAINEKTKDFEGMKVPVTVNVDKGTKKWTVEVGIPSAAALILKEAGIQKGSGTSGATWVGDISPDAVVKVAKLKIDSSYALNIKSASKEIIGTCLALGIKISGKNPKEATADLESGKWDDKFK